MTTDDTTTGDLDEDAADEGTSSGSRHRTDGHLRSPMLDDGQQLFPWWLPIPGLALAGTWAAYQDATGASAFLGTLLWPGAPIFVATTITTYFGWRLDLD
jgi:hypothetical protein